MGQALAVREEQEAPIQVRISAYREKGYNVIVPFEITNDRIDPYHAFRLAVVKINPDPNSGDVWSPGSKKVNEEWVKTLALTRPALQRIGMAAGVVWDPNHTKRMDNHSDPDYVEFKAVGLFRGPDGQWRTIQGTKEIDLRVIEVEIREQQRAKMAKPAFKLPPQLSYMKGKPSDDILEALVLRELTQWRKHKVARCETGAMLRALRSLGLKSQYLPSEIQKPFVFVRVDYQPDYSLPDVRQVTQKAIAYEVSSIFGGPPTVHGIPIPEEEAQTAHETISNGESVEIPRMEDATPQESPDDPAADRKVEEQQTIGDLTEAQRKQFEVGDLFTARAKFKELAPDGSGVELFFEILAAFKANKIEELQISAIPNVKKRLRKEYDNLKARLEGATTREQGDLAV